ncbi:MAG: hypothetical protein LBR40_04085 [Bacilli bacterium]|jgi:hypothetical protein|nr:hypothetical protein [Bacilli bacterium]
MRFFFDVDNTILEHSGFYSLNTERRIHHSIGEFPNENGEAIKLMYDSSICRNPDIVKDLFKLDNVFILTKYPDLMYEKSKQLRLCKVLDITLNELLTITNSEGIQKYISLPQKESKVKLVKEIFNIDDISDCVLVDDYSTNIIEWDNNGGKSIKYYNEYNSPNHPLKGISISNFKIFKPMLTQNDMKKIFISCDNSYVLNTIISIWNDKALVNIRNTSFNFKHIDILRIINNDLTTRLGINNITINTKYSLTKLLLDYYQLQYHIDTNYWTNILKNNLSKDNANLICASFDIDFSKLDEKNDESATIKVFDTDDYERENIYDIYLTLDTDTFLDNIDQSLESLLIFLSYYFFKDK